MRRTHSTHDRSPWIALLALGLLCCSPSIAATPDSGVQGRVLGGDERPVEKATVYAYEVASFEMKEVETDRRGRFLFDRLPAGMYQLVAFKPGFRPTVELLLRRTAESLQELEIELERDELADTRSGEDYWTVRGRVPADVLRQIQQIHAVNHAADGVQISESALYQAHMQALSGVQDLGGVSAQHTAAAFDVRGSVGSMKLGIDGRYETLSPRGSSLLDGEVRAVALKLASANEQRFRLATSTGQLDGLSPVDLQHYQLDWTGRTGASGETHVSARYTEESGYHRSGLMAPAGLPASSETWNLEGTYLQEIGSAHTLRTGITYRQRTAADSLLFGDSTSADALTDERLGVFGIASSQLQPRVLVEYGLYSTVRDGGLSLMPRGGVVVELGNGWRAETSAARRLETDEPELPTRSFDTAFYSDRDGCYDVGESCYEVNLARGEGDDQIRLGAIHREYAETLRVYFSPDFFDRLESVFMVEGDELPELRLMLARRIAPKVIAKLESNYAVGGGGLFYATDDTPYQNNVRYLVTSLDAQFQNTQTGVFVAFHHLEQSFDALDALRTEDSPRIEMQRLQLMLTQDLSALVDLASRWAVRLNMELSRGATPYTLTADDEIHKKLTGGFAVSF
ncbi:MAG: carboxypeptidase-like regulatory domain-containing protein [Acidobacteriota bacterium]